MPKSPEGYTPLLYRGSRGSLWLADDHLLVIENARFFLAVRENYRRLDFANIKAVLHAPCNRGAWITVLLSLGLLVNGAIFFSDPGEMRFFGFLSLVFVGLLVAHFIKGPTDRLLICTAVKAWPIKVVSRRSHTRKVVEALAQLCRTAQGELESVPSAPTEEQTVPAMSPPVEQLEKQPHPHRFALPGWLCLVAHCSMVVGEMVWNSVFLTVVMVAFGCAAFTLYLIAFSRGGGCGGVGGRLGFFSALGLLGFHLVSGYAVAMVGLVGEAYAADEAFEANEWGMLETLAAFPNGAPEELATGAWIVAGISLLVAMAGAMVVGQQRILYLREKKRVEPMPS